MWVLLAGGAGQLCGQEAFVPALARPDTGMAGQGQTLWLRLSNNNFLFDAEYFSPLEVGYTWIGVQLQPELVYRVTGRFLLRGGVYLLKYSGRKETSDVRPVFSAEYRFRKGVTLGMGSLYGSLNHRLPEPLYRYDRSMCDWPEEGVQLRVNTSRLKGDYWLQWRNFILPGDPFQEELVFGTSSYLRVAEQDGWRFTLPFFTMVHHQGGQIDSSPEPVHTFGNLAGGGAVKKEMEGSILRALEGEMLGFHYFDLSGEPRYDFTSGWGLQAMGGMALPHLWIRAGYWYGNRFFASLGEPLFASVSEKSFPQEYPVRSLLLYKVRYVRVFEKGISLTLYGDGYQDLRRGRFDYNVGLQLLFHTDILLLSEKRFRTAGE